MKQLNVTIPNVLEDMDETATFKFERIFDGALGCQVEVESQAGSTSFSVDKKTAMQISKFFADLAEEIE